MELLHFTHQKKTPINNKIGRIFVPGNELKKKTKTKGNLGTICT